MEKAGFQRWASELGLMIIAPDTSPRGDNVADDDGYDLGQGQSNSNPVQPLRQLHRRPKSLGGKKRFMIISVIILQTGPPMTPLN